MSEITFETNAELAGKQLRAKRDSLLAETDWMANSDITMTTAMSNYRQELRDLPANVTPTLNIAGDNPLDVVFPTKP